MDQRIISNKKVHKLLNAVEGSVAVYTIKFLFLLLAVLLYKDLFFSIWYYLAFEKIRF